MLNVSITDPFKQEDDGLILSEKDQIQLHNTLTNFFPQTYIRRFLVLLITIIDNYNELED